MFLLKVMTAERIMFQGTVAGVNAPGEWGYLEILTSHAPIISILKEGRITITRLKRPKLFYSIHGGILEAKNNEVYLLIDDLEIFPEIDKKVREYAHEAFDDDDIEILHVKEHQIKVK